MHALAHASGYLTLNENTSFPSVWSIISAVPHENMFKGKLQISTRLDNSESVCYRTGVNSAP
jgi:hypothetical protein